MIGPDKNTTKPSDHKMVLLYPRDNLNIIRKAEYVTKRVCPLLESRVKMFIKRCMETDFSQVCDLQNPDNAETLFLEMLKDIVDVNLPEKFVRLR